MGAGRVDDYFRWAVNIEAFARERLGFVPDAVQARILQSRGRRLLLNCARQWGKSTLAAIVALHRVYFVPRSLVLIVSPSERQSGELVEKIGGFLQELGEPVRGDGRNSVSLRLRNGSRVVGLPGEHGTIRGFSGVRLLLVDEAAQVPDVLYRAVRPMLAMGGPAGGDLWLMSTPYGKSGFFWKAWSEEPGWEKVTAMATECPRYPAGFLAEERLLGDDYFRQEYLCEFVDVPGAVFSEELVRAAFVDEERAWRP